MSNWDHVSSRLGNIQPATRSIAKEIYDAAAAAGHEIWFMWGMGASSEHATGRALDLMVRNKAAGDWIRNYVWANRARLRLRHVIWWQAITSTVVQPGVVRRMADRGNPTANHMDHPHIFVLPGAYQPPANQPSQGSQQDVTTPRVVRQIQQAVRVGVDGKWGPVTDRAVMAMRNVSRIHRGWPNRHRATFDTRQAQRIVGTTVDGIWGPKSNAALVRWIENFQGILGVKQDALWGPKTDGKLIALRRRHLNNY